MAVLLFDIITIFPKFFEGPLQHGIVHQAQKRGKVSVKIHDLRLFTDDRHKSVDDRPFGGGEGMVLKPEPLFRAVQAIYADSSARKNVILLSPQGRRFDHAVALQLSACEQVALICGRYEGVDERVAALLGTDEISVGDYVLSGGELAACLIVDATTRLVPGVLNKTGSTSNESFSTGAGGPAVPILDYPQYTRPETFQGLRVPEVLLSGDHKRIERWRRKKALEKTLKNRPDLLQYASLSEEDRELLNLEF